MKMGIERVIISAIIVSSLISMASAIAGSSTCYPPPYVPSACYGFQEQGVMIAAANPGLFANGAACGRRYRIRCTGSTSTVPACRDREVTVMIVDLCPACGPNQIALSQEACNIIANPAAARILIDYVQV